jgi:hypothetical protein
VATEPSPEQPPCAVGVATEQPPDLLEWWPHVANIVINQKQEVPLATMRRWRDGAAQVAMDKIQALAAL